VDTLINILTEPKNALVKQYQKFFRMEGSELQFTPGAMVLIAERALKRDTGARALRAVCEEIMLDLMYKLPDQQAGGKYLIDEAIVEGKRHLFEIKPPSDGGNRRRRLSQIRLSRTGGAQGAARSISLVHFAPIRNARPRSWWSASPVAENCLSDWVGSANVAPTCRWQQEGCAAAHPRWPFIPSRLDSRLGCTATQEPVACRAPSSPAVPFLSTSFASLELLEPRRLLSSTPKMVLNNPIDHPRELRPDLVDPKTGIQRAVARVRPGRHHLDESRQHHQPAAPGDTDGFGARFGTSAPLCRRMSWMR
jgi:hypothetical protein